MRAFEKATAAALRSAGSALLLCGCVGALVGAITGITIGVFFFLIGALIGGAWGVPVGFVAAVLGAAIGGRRAWTLSGLVCGTIGGFLMINSVFGIGPNPLSLENLALTAFSGQSIIAVLTGLGGAIVGAIVGRSMDGPPASRGMFGGLLTAINHSDLYDLSLPVRLILATAIITPLLIVTAIVVASVR